MTEDFSLRLVYYYSTTEKIQFNDQLGKIWYLKSKADEESIGFGMNYQNYQAEVIEGNKKTI